MNPEANHAGAEKTCLILFVVGDAPRSRRARANLARALERMDTDTGVREIDLIEQPDQSLRFGIFATPALLRIAGGQGSAVLYGDLSEELRLHRFLADAIAPGE